MPCRSRPTFLLLLLGPHNICSNRCKIYRIHDSDDMYSWCYRGGWVLYHKYCNTNGVDVSHHRMLVGDSGVSLFQLLRTSRTDEFSRTQRMSPRHHTIQLCGQRSDCFCLWQNRYCGDLGLSTVSQRLCTDRCTIRNIDVRQPQYMYKLQRTISISDIEKFLWRPVTKLYLHIEWTTIGDYCCKSLVAGDHDDNHHAVELGLICIVDLQSIRFTRHITPRRSKNKQGTITTNKYDAAAASATAGTVTVEDYCRNWAMAVVGGL